jgi:hypothetical protein
VVDVAEHHRAGQPRSFIARSSSVTDAAGSLSGSVASAGTGWTAREPRRERVVDLAGQLDRDLGRLDVTPGVVNDNTCVVTPSSSSTPCRCAMSRCPGTRML